MSAGARTILQAVLPAGVLFLACAGRPRAAESGEAGVRKDPSAQAGVTNRISEEMRVIDLVIVSSNQVAVGTRTLSLAATTNLVAAHRDSLDIVVLHGSVEGDASMKTNSSLLAEIARLGVPLVIVEKDGDHSWRKQSGADGIRTVKIGTDQVAALRRYWENGKRGGTSDGPVLQATVGFDAATGAYELDRVDLGLFGERVWLMHRQRGSDERSGTVGIQLKREW